MPTAGQYIHQIRSAQVPTTSSEGDEWNGMLVGHYKYLVMPFSLVNVLVVYQCFINFLSQNYGVSRKFKDGFSKGEGHHRVILLHIGPGGCSSSWGLSISSANSSKTLAPWQLQIVH